MANRERGSKWKERQSEVFRHRAARNERCEQDSIAGNWCRVGAIIGWRCHRRHNRYNSALHGGKREEREEWLSFVKNDKQWESTKVRDTGSVLLKHRNREGLQHKPPLHRGDEKASRKITRESWNRRRALVDEVVGRIRLCCKGPQMPSWGFGFHFTDTGEMLTVFQERLKKNI